MNGENLGILTFVAGSDITDQRLVEVTVEDTVAHFDGTGVAFGVAQAAATTGQSVAVATRGVLRVTAGGAITAGQPVKATSAGKVVAATTTGDFAIGVALSSASGDGLSVSICFDVKAIIA